MVHLIRYHVFSGQCEEIKYAQLLPLASVCVNNVAKLALLLIRRNLYLQQLIRL